MEEIEKIFKIKSDYYDDTLKIINDYRIMSYNTNLELLNDLSDFAIFTLMGAYDLFILWCDYARAIKQYQQNYYVRQASLVCFELLSDISQHFNKNYINLFVNKITDQTINHRALDIQKIFNKMRNDNESKLKSIRDLTIAHRDHNISSQINIMNNMDNGAIMGFAIKYLHQIESLHYLMSDAISYISNDLDVLGKEEFVKKYSI